MEKPKREALAKREGTFGRPKEDKGRKGDGGERLLKVATVLPLPRGRTVHACAKSKVSERKSSARARGI